MAKGVKDGSGGSHLVSYHGNGHSSSSFWFHRAAWLDFNSIQSGHGWARGHLLYQLVSQSYDTIQALSMQFHYLSCKSGVGRPSE